ncbi:MAG: hypothetical protein ACUVWX_00565 [Kiritimatiellia bacterium]
MNKLGFEYRAGVVLGILALAGQIAYGAVTGVEAIPLVVLKEGNVTVTQYGNGACDVSIAAQNLNNGYPSLQDCQLKADARTADGAFIGNYSGVAGMSFRVAKKLGTGATLELQLKGKAFGAVWKFVALKVADEQDVWVVNNVPMNRSAGWYYDPVSDDPAPSEEAKDTAWAQDLKQVESLTLVVWREGTYEELSLRIDDFVLKDANGFVVGTVTLSPLEVALLDHFGVTSVADLTAAQMNQQTIAEGIRDVDVILARFDPSYYAFEVFWAYVEQIPPDGVLIKWWALAGKRYTIQRKGSLAAVYQDVWTGTVEEEGWAQWHETQAGGPYFYKIVCAD